MDIMKTLNLNLPEIKHFEISGICEMADILLSREEYNGAYVIDIKINSKDGSVLDLSKMKILLSTTPTDTMGRWYPKTKQHDHAPHNSWEKPIETAYMNGAPIFCYFISRRIKISLPLHCLIPLQHGSLIQGLVI